MRNISTDSPLFFNWCRLVGPQLVLHFSRETSSAIKCAKVGGQGTILSVGWTYSTLLFTPSQYGNWCCNCSNRWYPHTLLCWQQTGDLSMRDVKYVNKTGWHFFCLQCMQSQIWGRIYSVDTLVAQFSFILPPLNSIAISPKNVCERFHLPL